MFVASQIRAKAGYPWFCVKCSNAWLVRLEKRGAWCHRPWKRMCNSAFHRQGRPSATRQEQVKRNPTRAAFGRPPFILITAWASKQLIIFLREMKARQRRGQEVLAWDYGELGEEKSSGIRAQSGSRGVRKRRYENLSRGGKGGLRPPAQDHCDLLRAAFGHPPFTCDCSDK